MVIHTHLSLSFIGRTETGQLTLTDTPGQGPHWALQTPNQNTLKSNQIFQKTIGQNTMLPNKFWTTDSFYKVHQQPTYLHFQITTTNTPSPYFLKKD